MGEVHRQRQTHLEHEGKTVSKEQFRITFSGTFSMTTEEIWPDGDGPENPTASDVKNRMINQGGKASLLSGWNLETDLDIAIVDEAGHTATWEGL